MSDARNPKERFEVLRKLGRGGMGLVRLARDRERGGLVALKSLGDSDDLAVSGARLRREGRTLERLNHPGIVKSIGILHINDRLILVQEYVEGMTLKQWFHRLSKGEQGSFDFAMMLRDIPEASDGSDDPWAWFDDGAESDEESEAETDKIPPPLSDAIRHHLRSSEHIRRCCEFIRQAAAALGHAHENGVRHRDVKPENLMIDRDERIRVIDFGIASFEGSQTWATTGAVIGSAYYMSPEHITGPTYVDEKSDVFSLGIVLYEALTLRSPYYARTPHAAFHEIVTKSILPVRWRNPGVPPALEAIVHKATNRDPEKRYRDGNAMQVDLENFLESKPVSALPYRYKPDYSDIVISSPKSVSLVVIISYLLAGFFVLSSLAGLTLSLADPATRQDPLTYVLASLLLGLGVIAVFLGRGLRHARRWALWTAGVGGLVVAMFSAILLIDELRPLPKNPFDLIIFLSLVCIGFFVPLSFVFSLGHIKQWEANAQLIRSQRDRPREPII